METEEQSNYNYSIHYADYAKCQFRKIKSFHLLITTFVIFLLAIPYIKDYNHNHDGVNNNEYKPIPFHNNPVRNMTCPHYKIALFIFSEMGQVDKRMLMR